MRLIGFAIYLGIGAMLHALFVGPHFDWSSAWTFGWLLGWPIMFFITFWTLAAFLVVAGIVIWVVYLWIEMLAGWLYGKQKV